MHGFQYFRIDALSDTLLTTALPLMLKLREVVLDHCHGVTIDTLWCMLEQPNMLSMLCVWYCKQIVQKDKEEIKAVIADENLSLSFEWHPYTEAEEALLEAGHLDIDSAEEDSEEEVS